MSQEHVEIVKAWYDAFNRDDWECHGQRLMDDVRETWESARQEPHEFIEAGDLVVVPKPWACRSKTLTPNPELRGTAPSF